MDPDRAKLLGELIDEMAQDPRGFIPDGAWAAVQKAFALPYIEMAIVRRGKSGQAEILLTHRTDKDRNGWHIPGGLWRTRQTLEQCIEKLAKVELGPQVVPKLVTKGTWEKWHDHPYGVPISHVAICVAEGVVESDTIQWFGGVPSGMIHDHGHHAGFIKNALSEADKIIARGDRVIEMYA